MADVCARALQARRPTETYANRRRPTSKREVSSHLSRVLIRFPLGAQAPTPRCCVTDRRPAPRTARARTSRRAHGIGDLTSRDTRSTTACCVSARGADRRRRVGIGATYRHIAATCTVAASCRYTAPELHAPAHAGTSVPARRPGCYTDMYRQLLLSTVASVKNTMQQCAASSSDFASMLHF